MASPTRTTGAPERSGRDSLVVVVVVVVEHDNVVIRGAVTVPPARADVLADLTVRARARSCARPVSIARSILLFVLAAVAFGADGFVATFQPDANFGRILAAYGGIFVAGGLLWGMLVDGFRPDRWDVWGVGAAGPPRAGLGERGASSERHEAVRAVAAVEVESHGPRRDVIASRVLRPREVA